MMMKNLKEVFDSKKGKAVVWLVMILIALVATTFAGVTFHKRVQRNPSTPKELQSEYLQEEIAFSETAERMQENNLKEATSIEYQKLSNNSDSIDIESEEKPLVLEEELEEGEIVKEYVRYMAGEGVSTASDSYPYLLSTTGQYYDSLGSAYAAMIDNAATTATITYSVNTNKMDSSVFTVASGMTITFNTNGNTYIKNTNPIKIENGGQLNITGGGTIRTKVVSEGVTIDTLIENEGILNITNTTITHNGMEGTNWYAISALGGTTTLNSGTISVTKASDMSNTEYSGRVIYMSGKANVNILGGTVTTSINHENGMAILITVGTSGTTNGTLTISGGSVYSKYSAALSIQANAGATNYTLKPTVQIKGGTVTSDTSQTIANWSHNSGNINISGGTVSTTQNTAIRHDGTGLLTISDNASITATTRTAILHTGSGNVSITGGTITASYFAYEHKATGKVNITGGTITGGAGSSNTNGIFYSDGEGDITISSSSNTSPAIIAEGGVAINKQSAGKVIVTGGMIKANGVNQTAINNSNGTIIIGANDNSVYVTRPVIQGSVGINSANGFEYYDGIIKGSTAAISGGAAAKVVNKPTNYEIIYSNETDTTTGTKYETVHVGKNETNVSEKNFSVTQNGQEKFYQTLADAYVGVIGINNSYTSGTINLLRTGILDTSEVLINSGKNVTINTAGKVLVRNENVIQNNGTLTIGGGGTLRTNQTPSMNQLGNIISNAATLVIDGTTVESMGKSTGSWNAISSTGGSVTVKNGGVVRTSGTGATSNTRAIEMLNATNVIINDTSIVENISNLGEAIASWSDSTYTSSGLLTINNGTVSSTSSMAIFFYGKNNKTNGTRIMMKGGTVTTTATATSAILLSKTSEGSTNGAVTIQGGQIQSAHGVALNIAGDTPAENVTIGVTDSNVSTATPVLQGGTYGISATNGFSFQDGLLKGATEAIAGGQDKVTAKPNGYEVSYRKETGSPSLEVAYLSQYPNYSVTKGGIKKFYVTLERAYIGVVGINNDSNSGTIVVEKTNTDDSIFTVANGKIVTIKTNGKTVVKTNHAIEVEAGGSLAITENGAMRTTTLESLISNAGTLSITDATIENANTSNNLYYTIVSTAGSITTNNATIKATGTASQQAVAIEPYLNTNVTISGGEVSTSTSGNAIEIYADASHTTNTGIIKIIDATIKNTQGIAIKGHSSSSTYQVAKKIEMTGGSIEAKDSGIAYSDATTGTIVISGGSITSSTNYGIYNGGTGIVTLGTQNGTGLKEAPVIVGYSYGVRAKGGLEFYDGWVKGLVDAYDGNLLAKEKNYSIIYEPYEVNGKYYETAWPDTNPNYSTLFSGAKRYHRTLDGAYRNLIRTTAGTYDGTGGTITLEQSNTDTPAWTIAANKQITLNTQDKYIAKMENGITNKGNLTITGNGTLRTTTTVANNVIDNLITNQGKLEIKGSTLVNVGKTTGGWNTILSTSGTVNVSGGTVSVQGAPSTEARAISMLGTTNVTVSDGTVKNESSNGQAVASWNSADTTSTGTLKITGGTLSATAGNVIKFFGVDNKTCGANIEMTGGAIRNTATNSSADAILMNDTANGSTEGSITITGGTILAEGGLGIHNLGSGTTTIGQKGGEVSITVPEIKGREEGIATANGFNFYDGVLKGQTVGHTGNVTEVEPGYVIHEEMEGTYHIEYLINTAKYVIHYYTHDLGSDTYTLNSTVTESGLIGSSINITKYEKTISGFTFEDAYIEGDTTKPSTGAINSTTILPDGTREINLYYRRNYLYVQYHVNNGTMLTEHGADYDVSNSLVTSTNNATPTKFLRGVYGGKVGATNLSTYVVENDGLHNYNNPVVINIGRVGYEAKSNAQWNTNANGTGTSYDQDLATYDVNGFAGADLTNGDATVTLYVNWTPIEYTITYDLDGGSMTGQRDTYHIETSSFVLPTPTKTNYTFVGWTGSNGTTPQLSVSINKGSTGDKEFKANWKDTVAPNLLEAVIRLVKPENGITQDGEYEVTISDVRDNVGIERYEWEMKQKDEGTWKMIKEDISSLTTSSVEGTVTEEETYQVRVKVYDAAGNSTISNVVEFTYQTSASFNAKPTIKFEKPEIVSGDNLVKIHAIVKSTTNLVSAKVNLDEIIRNSEVVTSEDNWSVENFNKVEGTYQIRNDIIYTARVNAIYKFEVTDSNGNTVSEVYNVNDINREFGEIHYRIVNATATENAKIIFTISEDVWLRKITNLNGASSNVYEQQGSGTNYAREITVLINGSENEVNAEFVFENTAGAWETVTINELIDSAYHHVRNVPDSLAVKKITDVYTGGISFNRAVDWVTRMMNDRVIKNGESQSYYGIDPVKAKMSVTNANVISAVRALGSATLVQVRNSDGNVVELEKGTVDVITSAESASTSNGNKTGVYFGSSLVNDSNDIGNSFHVTIMNR